MSSKSITPRIKSSARIRALIRSASRDGTLQTLEDTLDCFQYPTQQEFSERNDRQPNSDAKDDSSR